MPTIANITDYREAARRRIPHVLFEYLDGGSYDQITLGRNVEDMRKLALRQLVLRDVSKLSMETTWFGKKQPLPIGLGPVGFSGMFARRGEIQAIKAAQKSSLPATLSFLSICSLEEVSRAVADPIWFQLYVLKDRGFITELLATAKKCKVPVLVFTVDLPIPGTRYRDIRSGMSGTPSLWQSAQHVMQALQRPEWLWDVQMNGQPLSFGNLAPVVGEKTSLGGFAKWVAQSFDASVNWNDIAWIRERWDGKIVIKGILDPEDARMAQKMGVEGIVVSNHGGRQLDGVLSGVAALPPIRDAVDGDMTVLMDGGVRSGLDVLRAMALGADGCLLGRAWAYALAARGQAGVEHVISLIRDELHVAMTLTGCTDIRKADRSLLA
jgi:L-lactate dehydrogenase (cytochrome)